MAAISKAKKLELTQAFRRLVELAIKDSIDLLAGEVLAVNEKERTCDVQLSDDELTLEGVRLQTVGGSLIKGGLCLIPKIGSQITVAREDGALESVFVIATSELEKIIIEIGKKSLTMDASGLVFNTGKNGGLPITPKLVKRLNAIETRLDTLEQSHATHVHPVTAVSTPTGAATPTFVPGVNAQTTDSDIENSDIKQ